MIVLISLAILVQLFLPFTNASASTEEKAKVLVVYTNEEGKIKEDERV